MRSPDPQLLTRLARGTQHNQRTLELGLRMTDTLRDGVRVLAEAQAEWIKSLAMHRTIPRNATTIMTPAVETAARDAESGDHEEAPSFWAHMAPYVPVVMEYVKNRVATRNRASREEPPPAPDPAELARKVMQAAKLLTVEEQRVAMMVWQHLTPEQRETWAEELAPLSVEGAAARVRSVLAALPKEPPASSTPAAP